MKVRIISIFSKLLILLFCFGMLLNIIKVLEERKVSKYGSKVEVLLKKIPENCHKFSKTRKDFEFEYNHKLYVKWVGYGICDKKVDDKLILIHWEAKEDIFLYPEEDINSDLFTVVLLFLLGLLGLIITFWIYP